MTEIININKIIQVVKVTSPKIQIATIGTQGPPGSDASGGSSAHATLTGLENDDHPQYHNEARGDARYYTKPQMDDALAGKADTSHGHTISDVSGLQTALDGKLDASFAILIPKTGQVMVDFGNASGGEADLASVTVAAAWVTDSSVILCNPAGVATPDHDAEEAALEGITAIAANLNEGVGFDVIARAPLGSWGRFNINIIGV
jgi:hypothetical protein